VSARLRGIVVFTPDGTLRAGILIGVVFAFEFIIINVGLTLTTATGGAIFLYTSPFFIALGATMLLGEKALSSAMDGPRAVLCRCCDREGHAGSGRQCEFAAG
jgi:drug/metabolite transporter (DMT)-like permease